MPLPRSSTSTCTPFIDLSTSKHLRRTRFCLLSHHGFVTDDGFTDDPSEAIQIIDHSVAVQRISTANRIDLIPVPVTFEFNGHRWHPITHER